MGLRLTCKRWIVATTQLKHLTSKLFSSPRASNYSDIKAEVGKGAMASLGRGAARRVVRQEREVVTHTRAPPPLLRLRVDTNGVIREETTLISPCACQ